MHLGFEGGCATRARCQAGLWAAPPPRITSPEPVSRSMHAARECSVQNVEPVLTCRRIAFEPLIGREDGHESGVEEPLAQHYPCFNPIRNRKHLCILVGRRRRRPSWPEIKVRESAKEVAGIRCRVQRLVPGALKKSIFLDFGVIKSISREIWSHKIQKTAART